MATRSRSNCLNGNTYSWISPFHLCQGKTFLAKGLLFIAHPRSAPYGLECGPWMHADCDQPKHRTKFRKSRQRSCYAATWTPPEFSRNCLPPKFSPIDRAKPSVFFRLGLSLIIDGLCPRATEPARRLGRFPGGPALVDETTYSIRSLPGLALKVICQSEQRRSLAT